MRCPWPIDIEACCRGAGLDLDDESNAARVASVIDQVSEMLARWSGGAYGGCATVRPLEPCGRCRTGCCAQGDCLVLHSASAVTAVRIYGNGLDPDDYRFDPARGVLCTTLPGTRWPHRDPRSAEVPAMEVDTLVGAEPDAWALAVAAELACELLRSCAGEKCRLPRNATQVTAQGVTITLAEDELKYALPSVIAWVQTVNPVGAKRPARVLSPEADAARLGSSSGVTVGAHWRGRW